MEKPRKNMEKVSNMIQYDPIQEPFGVPQPLIHPTAMVSTEIPPGNHRGARDQMVPIAEMMQCWASTYRKVPLPHLWWWTDLGRHGFRENLWETQ